MAARREIVSAAAGVGSAFAWGALDVSGYQNIYLASALGLCSIACIAYAGWIWIGPKGVFRREIPLREAARHAYEATRGTLHARMAEREPTEAELLNWYAINLAASRGIPIYGKHPVTRKRELVSWDEADFSDIAEGGTIIRDATTNKVYYIDLSVKRGDFAAALAELKRLAGC